VLNTLRGVGLEIGSRKPQGALAAFHE